MDNNDNSGSEEKEARNGAPTSTGSTEEQRLTGEDENVVPGPTVESEEDRELLLSQYIHYGEAAIATSDQRVKTNRFFGALLASVLAGLFLFARGSLDGVSAIGLAFGGTAGFIVCTFWHRSIEGYRRLNGTRYQILNRIEENLPAPVYRDEWRYLKQKDEPLELLPDPDPDAPVHTSHTIVERWLVRLLAVGYLLVTLYAVALLYLTYVHPLPITALPLNTVLPGILIVVTAAAIVFYWHYR